MTKLKEEGGGGGGRGRGRIEASWLGFYYYYWPPRGARSPCPRLGLDATGRLTWNNIGLNQICNLGRGEVQIEEAGSI